MKAKGDLELALRPLDDCLVEPGAGLPGGRDACEVSERLADEHRLTILERTGLLEPSSVDAFDVWTAVARNRIGAAAVLVSLVQGSSVLVKSLSAVDGAGPPEPVVPLTESLSQYVVGGGDSRRVADVRRDPVLRHHAAEMTNGIVAFAAAPVRLEGHVLGSVCAVEFEPRDWSDDDLRALEEAAEAVSLEAKRRLAEHEVTRMQHLLDSHNRVHELIGRAAPLQEVLGELVEGIERYDPSVIACVVRLDPESNTLHPGAAPSLPAHYLEAIDGVVIGPDVGTCGAAAWSGRTTITEDMEQDPKWAPIIELAREANLRHCWSTPIKAPDGEVLGTFALYGPRPRRPLPEHLPLMQDGARMAGIAIERHRTLERLVHDATHDDLTGLLNRTATFERLERAIDRSPVDSGVAVFFVDLDGLKHLNDTLGHDRADELIRVIGSRLAAAVRSGDVVGRFGGDEFVVVAERMRDPEEAAELGFRLLESVSMRVEGVAMTASIGISLVSAGVGDAREAIRQADRAMYDAKRSGRDRVCFFQDAVRVRTGRRLALTGQLRGAIERAELRVVFQPLFDVKQGSLTGVEALLRWDNPTLGAVSPAEFVPVAEETGAIAAIGAWVLEESCVAMARLGPEAGGTFDLAVNVSAKQLGDPGFARSVRETLSRTGFPVERLVLEITETALLNADPVTERTLHDLRALGARIALDDFGTGYSSLSWLKRYSLDAIKIDRSFVAGLPGNPGDSAIVAAVIGMARAFGRSVTAEGVETELQLDALRGLGCDQAQGFLLARPAPVEELEELLRA